MNETVVKLGTNTAWTPCRRESVGQDEFFKASEIDLTPSFRIITRKCNYNGEKKLTYDNKVYAIYRTAEYRDDVTLYCCEKLGVV